MAESVSTQDPDLGILRRVADGDTESYGVLVERHQDRLLRLCERMLGDKEEARDAAQEVFVKVFRKAASYQPRGKVYTWLYRIAVNHCLNRLRRRKLVRFLSFGEMGRPTREGEEGSPFDPPDAAPGPEEHYESRRRWAHTRARVDALPAGQRAVFVLTKFEGLSYKETAETLGISIGAVESRLFRAMRSLLAAQEKVS